MLYSIKKDNPNIKLKIIKHENHAIIIDTTLKIHNKTLIIIS